MTDSIEIEWLERDLRALDRAVSDIVVGSIFADERPPRGVAALVDWRMSGRLSARCLNGFLTGARGEQFLMPGRPKLPFEKVLLFGLGPRTELDEARFSEVLSAILDTLAGLQVRRAAIDLPGRHQGSIPSSRALEILAQLLDGRSSSLETIAIVDDRETQRAVEALRARPGRRSLAGRR
jgi:hypothetical protein